MKTPVSPIGAAVVAIYPDLLDSSQEIGNVASI
jgi:hypothetical protein